MKHIRLLPLLGLVLALSACERNTTEPSPPASSPAPEQSGYSALTTEQLQARLNTPDTLVIDTRSNDAFNGWIVDSIEPYERIKRAR